MQGLPSDLYNECRATLMRCGEFKSYQALRTVFVTDQLVPFRIGLRSADNPNDLVDLCIEYLLEQRLSNGYPVLPIFLMTLRNRYPIGNALRSDLEAMNYAVHNVMALHEPKPSQILHRDQLLFNSLLKLDFGDQIKKAIKDINEERAVALLIHGGAYRGQQVLVTRLLRLNPNWKTMDPIKISLGSNGMGRNSRAIWRQVASRLNLATDASPDRIADGVCKRLQTQDVTFIFDSVDCMLPDVLRELIEEFWQPLVKKVCEDVYFIQNQTRLVMFLVDYEGSICKWDLAVSWQNDQSDYTHTPRILPPADRFSKDILDFWLVSEAEVLPIGLTAEMLLEASENGIPQLIYDIVSSHCGLSWEGELARWLV